jgi:tetratricopeptide (TPR) repeat protein
VWGDGERSVQRPQTGVYRLRRALEPVELDDGPRLRTIRGGHLLSVEPGVLDAEMFARWVRDGSDALERADLRDAAEAEPLLVEAIELARREQNAQLAAHALSHLGWAAEPLGDYDRSRELHVEAIATARDAQTSVALEIALNNYAVMIARLGDLVAARPLLEESMFLARRRGEPSRIAIAAANLAIIALVTGDLEAAKALNRDALIRAREVDFRGLVSAVLITQTLILLALDNLEDARAASPTQSSRNALGSRRLTARANTPRRGPQRIERLRSRWQPEAIAEVGHETEWDAHWSAGLEMSLDDALELARGATRIEGSAAQRPTISI